ncbi:MAG: Fe-S cluster assembly ATPase SufC [Magnetococcales bacterium]|nr:Fe-S cluster assembly ATPase SufC [Magnetococcales bacterium]
MLNINNLHAQVDDKDILKGINLNIAPGEVHVVMGPNGSGKSTLANLLAGRDGYTVSQGEVIYKGKDLLTIPTEERAWAGIFLAFQYPVEIPGVSNLQLLKAALNAKRRNNNLKELDAFEFLEMVRSKIDSVGMSEELLQRAVNVGFSGGEKKRNEILQMTILEPDLVILDETDSGLDIDALRIVGRSIEAMRDSQRAFLIVTHYQRMLDSIKPDYIHVLSDGYIVKTGGSELALELEERGYSWLGKGEAA